MENKTLLFAILLLSLKAYATEITCPPIAECKIDQLNSCSVASNHFEIDPFLYDVKQGTYEFYRAYISSLHTDYGQGKCLYRNGNIVINFNIAGKSKVNIDKLAPYWKQESVRGFRSWKCKESSEACVFQLL